MVDNNRSAAMTPAEIREARRNAPKPLGGRMVPLPCEMRGQLVEKNGKQFYQVDGYATTYNKFYVMWDMWGEFKEKVADQALTESLTAGPDVAFLVNHKGVTMARTTNETLTLQSDAHGLHVQALLNADRQDVRDLMSAINDELVDQMSFAFMLLDGEWNDDYTEFTITQADINRGDVSAVNYGANPYTNIFARAQEWVNDAGRMPESARRAALGSLLDRDEPRASLEAAPEETRAVDADEDVNSLALAVDAALDAMADCFAECDMSTQATEMQQAADLLTAAETAVDELLDALGLDDPDDQDAEGDASLSAPETETRQATGNRLALARAKRRRIDV
jgi:HK97 family phage prohead protease